MTNRRAFIAGLSAVGLSGCARGRASKPRVVIVGGGFGGASAAQHLAAVAPHIDVTLIDTNSRYHACPLSNLVIAGLREPGAQDFGYDGLRAKGITVLHGWVQHVDPARQTVTIKSGNTLPYDRLILSPGIDMRWDALDGYRTRAAQTFPHAWKGQMQQMLLTRRLQAMDDGGVVIISVPRAPYRCPPGPYERASLMAHYLKTHKPRSKVIILDAKESFSKQPLFERAWGQHYGDMIEWRGASDDGIVGRVNTDTGTVDTDFETFTPALANIIPPQMAGRIAARAGATDSTGWCPVDALDFSSTLVPNIHVIGDAAIATPMPKSAFSANLQGKLVAVQIARHFAGLPPAPTVLTNTCYSFVTPSGAVSITGAYRNDGGALSQIEDAGGLSPLDLSLTVSEAAQAQGWFSAVTQEAFG